MKILVVVVVRTVFPQSFIHFASENMRVVLPPAPTREISPRSSSSRTFFKESQSKESLSPRYSLSPPHSSLLTIHPPLSNSSIHPINLYSALPADPVCIETEMAHTTLENLAQSPRPASSRHFPF